MHAVARRGDESPAFQHLTDLQHQGVIRPARGRSPVSGGRSLDLFAGDIQEASTVHWLPQNQSSGEYASERRVNTLRSARQRIVPRRTDVTYPGLVRWAR